MKSASFPAAFDEAGAVAPSKQAALFLHGVGPSDRDWLLGQLGPKARLELTGLLIELEALGISPTLDTAPAGAAVGHSSGKPVDLAPPPSMASLAAAVMAVPVHQVARQLCDEPDRLIQRLIRHTDKGWNGRLIGLLEAGQRSRLECDLSSEPRTDASPPDALDLALLQALVRRLAKIVNRPARRLDAWMSRARMACRRRLQPHAHSPAERELAS